MDPVTAERVVDVLRAFHAASTPGSLRVMGTATNVEDDVSSYETVENHVGQPPYVYMVIVRTENFTTTHSKPSLTERRLLSHQLATRLGHARLASASQPSYCLD